MSELSPAAFAVVNAFVCAHARKSDPSSNADIAAALRAAADHLGQDLEFYNTRMVAARDLLTIADELEAL